MTTAILAIYLFSVGFVFFKYPRFFFIASPLVISHVWTSVSALYLSKVSSYMYELQYYSQANERSGYLSGFYLIFLVFSVIFFLATKQKYITTPNKQKKSRYLLYSILLTVYLILFILLYNVMISGSPFLNSFDRFNFWDQAQSPILKKISDQLFVIMIVFATIASQYTESKKWIPRLAVYLTPMLAVLYQVLLGEKFSGIVLIILAFIIPYSSRKPEKYKKLLPLFFISIVILVLPFLFFTFKNTYNAQNPVQAITNRIFVAQGQLWYAVSESARFSTNAGLQPLINELTTPDGTSTAVGIYKLMGKYSSEWLANDYLTRGVRMAMGFPAIMTDRYGFALGLVYTIFVAALFGAACKILSVSIFHGSLLEVALASKIFSGVYNLSTDGTLSLFFSPSMLFYIVFYFMVVTLRSATKRSPSRRSATRTSLKMERRIRNTRL